MCSTISKAGSGHSAAAEPDHMLGELQRIRLEQAKTNELLRQILLPLEIISCCCAAMLTYLQRLTASCSTAIVLLEDCSRALRAVLLNTSSITALLTAAAAAATREGLLYEHAVHAERGMNVAVAACLLAGAAVGLPYRWRTCRSPPLPSVPPHGFASWAGALDLWRMRWLPELRWRLWNHSALEGWPASARNAVIGGVGGGDTPRARGKLMGRLSLLASALYGGGGGGTTSAGGAGGHLDKWWLGGKGVGGGSGWQQQQQRRWWWQLWGVSGRAASVLLCRTRMTGGFLLGGLVLALWTAVRWYLASTAASTMARRRQALPLPPPPVAVGSKASRLQTLFLSPSLDPSSLIGGGGGGGALARAAMWRRSATVVLVHSAAWLTALTAMGGSPTAWLALQLTWHAVLPYAITSLVPAAATEDPAVAATTAQQSASHRHGAILPSEVVRLAAHGTLDGGDMGGLEQHGGGAVLHGAGDDRDRSSPGGVPAADAADAADARAGRQLGRAVAAEGGDRSSMRIGRSDDSGGGHGASSLGGGFFGLRLRFKSRSALGSKAGSGPASGFGLKAGYRRSAQLHASRHCATAFPGGDGGGGASAGAADLLAAAPAPAAGECRTSATPVTAAEAEASSSKLTSTAAKLASTAALAAPSSSSWSSSRMPAAARAVGPLLAALWLYGGPLLLGAAPVLPSRWLLGALAGPMFCAACCLAVVMVAAAPRSGPAAASPSAVAAASDAYRSVTGGQAAATAPAAPAAVPTVTAASASTTAVTSPSRPVGHAGAVAATAAACARRR